MSEKPVFDLVAFLIIGGAVASSMAAAIIIAEHAAAVDRQRSRGWGR